MAPRSSSPRTDATKAVAYLRVSTEDQQLGPEAQRAAIEAWAKREGVTVVAWHTDHGVSGAAHLDNRPGLMDALDSVKHHRAGRLVVAKRDRLARDVMAAGAIERLMQHAGARIYSADGVDGGDGPEGMLLRGVVDLFAAYERSLIRARTKAALARKKVRGERVGSVPLGSRVASDGVSLEEDPDEAQAVARVLELRAEGLSYARIAVAMNDEGWPTRTGGPWHAQQALRIVRASQDAIE